MMTILQIESPGSKGYGNHAAMLTNAEQLWRQAMIDSKDGKRIVNADGTLRHEDHRRIMEEVTAVRRRTLNGIADLMSGGLTSPESIETQLVGVENINEFQAAKRSMNPVKSQNNDTNFVLSYTPLPITHQSWEIPWRQGGFSYKKQLGLTESVRQVSESLEDMLFNGDSNIRVSIGGGTPSQIYGYANHPNRVQVGITDWSNPANLASIIPDALLLVKEMFKTNGGVGRKCCVLYVGNDVWPVLQGDYSTTKGEKTVLERLLALVEIKDVKPAEKLLSKDVLLVEMEPRTIQLAVASDIVTVPHQRVSAMDNQTFTTYGAMVPLIRVDRNSRTGIVHGVEAL